MTKITKKWEILEKMEKKQTNKQKHTRKVVYLVHFAKKEKEGCTPD